MSGQAVAMLRLSPVVRLHLWCDRCCTSAGIEVDLCMLGDSGVTRIGTYRACRRCDDDTEQP